jgi:exodeoxyribonuclease VII small subunit
MPQRKFKDKAMVQAMADIDNFSFEKALSELEQIVTKLERGDIPLQDSIAAYERGEALKNRCEKLLKDAELKVEKIRLGQDNKVAGLGPLDDEGKE